jgi:hypothetical protein
MLDTLKPERLSRREEFIRVAAELRARFNLLDIDRIAEECHILLIRTSGSKEGAAGFAHVEYYARPEYIESLARPGELLPVWEPEAMERLASIVINTLSRIPAPEIFWHEWYHLFYSPERVQGSQRFEHRFLAAISDSMEERRADEFAAAILVPSLADCETVGDIMERFGVTGRLAAAAIRLHGNQNRHIEAIQ